jgi:hypothetical protein
MLIIPTYMNKDDKEKQAALPAQSGKPGQISSGSLPWKATDSFSWMQGILT